MTLSDSGLGISQLLGAAFIGIGLLAWGARNDTGSLALRGIVLGLLIGDAAGFVVSLIGQLSGWANPLGWSTVAIYLIFTLGYAYFQFIRPVGD